MHGNEFHNVHIGNVIKAGPAPTALKQLPLVESAFTGRHAELEEIAGLLDPGRDGGPVVVSAVAGLPGVGKTALAIAAGHAALQAGWFPGGVLFIDLHGYDQAPVLPEGALDSLLRALGVAANHIPTGLDDRARLYRSALANISDPLLLMVDNASSEAQVEPLLPGPGPHMVLITSRHTLAGLDARLLDVGTLDDLSGVMLLDTALHVRRPDDNRIGTDREAAHLLARLCGGLPLALRITAALLASDPALTVEELADQLSDEVTRLSALRYDRGKEASALSVKAAFELSYRKLDDEEARLFRLLPVNPGPDVSTAAAAILADLSVTEVRSVISRLVKAHLVESAAGAASRWRMHDLVRLYARQLSDAHAEADHRGAALDRLLAYYLTSSKAASDHLRVPPDGAAREQFTGRDDALAWMDAEWPSLIGAVSLATATGRDQIAMSLPLNLGEYPSLRHRFDDWLTVSEISRRAAQSLGDQANEAAALNNLGLALQQGRRYEEAITAHQQAATIYGETHHRRLEGTALNNLGMALRKMRRFEEALTAHQQAAAIYRETGDLNGMGKAIGNLGSVLAKMRRFEEAITAHQLAAAIYRETGDLNGMGKAIDNLGLALGEMRRFEEAITAHQQAAAIYRETGDRHDEASALNSIGVALMQTRHFKEATAAYQDASAIYREIGDRHGTGMTLGNLGMVLGEMRRFEEAITAHQQAAAIYRETHDRHSEGAALTNLGMVLAEMRRFEEAIAAYQLAAAIYRETRDRHSEGTVMNNLGVALQYARRFNEAIIAHQSAISIYRETRDRHLEGVALKNLESAQLALSE